MKIGPFPFSALSPVIPPTLSAAFHFLLLILVQRSSPVHDGLCSFLSSPFQSLPYILITVDLRLHKRLIFLCIYIKPFFSICECKKCGRLDLPYCVLVLQWHERIIKTLRNVILIQAENEAADLSVLLCNSLAIKPILGKMTSKAILKLIGWWSAWEDIFS